MSCPLELTEGTCWLEAGESRAAAFARYTAAFVVAQAELMSLLASEYVPERLEAAALAAHAAALRAGLPSESLHRLHSVRAHAAERIADARCDQRAAYVESRLGQIPKMAPAERRHFRVTLNRINRRSERVLSPRGAPPTRHRGQRARRPTCRRAKQTCSRRAQADSGGDGDGDGDGDGPPGLARQNGPAPRACNRAIPRASSEIALQAAVPPHAEAVHG